MNRGKEMLGVEGLAAILIILPFLTAIVCYLVRVSGIRSFVVLLTGGVLIASAVLIIPLTPFSFSPQPLWGVSIHTIVRVLLLLVVLLIDPCISCTEREGELRPCSK